MRSLVRLANQIYARPVAITPAAWAAIDEQFRAALERDRVKASDDLKVSDDDDDDQLDLPYRVAGDVAIVPLHGVCGRHLSSLDMACGGVDVDVVASAIYQAVEDATVSAIVLDVDSPGGSVSGVPNLGKVVRDASKPVVAFIDDLGASAAYWVSSQAAMICVGPAATVGSVGVYCAVLDESRKYEANGKRVDVIASGKYKGAGIPGTSLTAEQRAQLQAEIDGVASVFRGAVMDKRKVSVDLLDGRCLIGADAVSAGFADAVTDLTGAVQAAHDIAHFAAAPAAGGNK